MYVNSNIRGDMSLFYPCCYELIYILLFLNSLIFILVGKILGRQLPPPPHVPTAMPYDLRVLVLADLLVQHVVQI